MMICPGLELEWAICQRRANATFNLCPGVEGLGNTVTVIGKMGEAEISINHPIAPGYHYRAAGPAEPFKERR
jgi:hypothetical protein